MVRAIGSNENAITADDDLTSANRKFLAALSYAHLNQREKHLLAEDREKPNKTPIHMTRIPTHPDDAAPSYHENQEETALRREISSIISSAKCALERKILRNTCECSHAAVHRTLEYVQNHQSSIETVLGRASLNNFILKLQAAEKDPKAVLRTE